MVYQVLDSFLYLSRSEDGCVGPATKGSDGAFHVIGESVLADKEQQHRIFKMMAPLLAVASNCSVVIVPPIPRYLDSGCCEDPTHVSNIKQPDYKSKLEEQVYSCKANFKDFSFTSGLRNCRVVAAWPAIKKRAIIWHDPVHPVEGAYDDLAKVVVAWAPTKPAEKSRRSRNDSGPPAKRQRVDSHWTDPGCTGGRGGGGGRGFGGRSSSQDSFYTTRGARGGPRPFYYSGRGHWGGGGGGGGGFGRATHGRRRY